MDTAQVRWTGISALVNFYRLEDVPRILCHYLVVEIEVVEFLTVRVTTLAFPWPSFIVALESDDLKISETFPQIGTAAKS